MHITCELGSNEKCLQFCKPLVGSVVQWVTDSANKQRDPGSVPGGDTDPFGATSGRVSGVQKGGGEMAKSNMLPGYPYINKKIFMFKLQL